MNDKQLITLGIIVLVLTMVVGYYGITNIDTSSKSTSYVTKNFDESPRLFECKMHKISESQEKIEWCKYTDNGEPVTWLPALKINK